MKKLLTLLVIPTLLLLACNSQEEICPNLLLAESDISSQEEYLIIEAIINEQFSNSNLPHISQETHFESDSSFYSEYFKSEELQLESDIIKEYKEINSVPSNWGDSFDTTQNLISEEELACLFENNIWIGFYAKYPDSGGYFNFGKPIQYNQNEALVTFDLLCGWECASGHTVTLRKENGTWKVKTLITVWIS